MNEISPFYETDIKCPVCNVTFKVTKTRSKFLKLVKRDSDNCPYYKDINPIFYTAYVCPECGYAALERHFSNISVSGKAQVKKHIRPKWKHQDFSGQRDVQKGITVHRLVLLNYTVMDYPYSEIGKLCLKIAWLYRYLQDEKEQTFLEEAYTMFERAYTGEPLEEDPKNEMNVLFLMGETARRLGKFKKSVEWFGMVLQVEEIKNNKALENQVRDQRAEAKAAYIKEQKEQKEQSEKK